MSVDVDSCLVVARCKKGAATKTHVPKYVKSNRCSSACSTGLIVQAVGSNPFVPLFSPLGGLQVKSCG